MEDILDSQQCSGNLVLRNFPFPMFRQIRETPFLKEINVKTYILLISALSSYFSNIAFLQGVCLIEWTHFLKDINKLKIRPRLRCIPHSEGT